MNRVTVVIVAVLVFLAGLTAGVWDRPEPRAVSVHEAPAREPVGAPVASTAAAVVFPQGYFRTLYAQIERNDYDLFSASVMRASFPEEPDNARYYDDVLKACTDLRARYDRDAALVAPGGWPDPGYAQQVNADDLSADCKESYR